MTATETFVLEGHLVDTLTLPKVFNLILENGADYRVLRMDIGKTPTDTSVAELEVKAANEHAIGLLAELLRVEGANPAQVADAELVTADSAGVLPFGFHSTTNLPTAVRVEGAWYQCENPEMDCGLVVIPSGGDTRYRVRTVPMHRVAVGDRIVIGKLGVRVTASLSERALGGGFAFMESDVSMEKPKMLLIRTLADQIRAARAAGEKVLAVCGPAVVHTGGSPQIARMVRGGWINVLFAGNGFATHDMESNVLGTSLGVSVTDGAGTEGGHANHLRVINEIRRHGSIAAAVRDGYVKGGTMYECVQGGVPFLLGGSIRDDGPLPDTMTDVVAAADLMRVLVQDVGVAMMLATTLHGIATGNVLAARTETWCIDINPAVVTKLADRGSHQTHGVVTDVAPFLRLLADELEANGPSCCSN